MIIDQLLTIDNYVYLCYFKVSLHTYILSSCVLDSVAIVDQLGQYDCPLVSIRNLQIRYQ